jgi:hypothetical protein
MQALTPMGESSIYAARGISFVVGQLRLSHLQIASHRGPLVLRVGERSAQRILGQHILAQRGNELADIHEDRPGFPLPQFQASFQTQLLRKPPDGYLCSDNYFSPAPRIIVVDQGGL